MLTSVRFRKVKCDETRPCCQRCSSTGRKCEYKTSSTSSPLASSSLSLHSTAISPPGVNSSALRERRAFEYYFHYGALSIAGSLDIGFWKGIVLQLSRSEPAIWDAVIAISALYENPSCPSSSVGLLLGSTSKNDEALVWYSRSIGSARKLIEQSKANEEIAIVTCVLYICIETMQGHVNEALQLYEQGLRLIHELKASVGKYRMPFLDDTVIPLFLRMGTAALSTAGVPVVKDLFALADYRASLGLFNAEAARAVLSPITRESILFQWEAEAHLLEVGSAACVSSEMITRQEMLLSRLENWHRSFIELIDYEDPNNSMHLSAISTLRVFHAAIFIMLSTCLTQWETDSDAYLEYFKIIVQNASRVVADGSSPDGSQARFTFEAGVGEPLFAVTMKCRDPQLRREALSLLRRVPQVQGFFQCAPRAARAEQYILMEEAQSIPGLMIRSSDLSDITMESNALPEGVKEVSKEKLANLPAVGDLVIIEEEPSGYGQHSFVPEEKRIRKFVVVWLQSRAPNPGRTEAPPARPFLHFTRNRPVPGCSHMWEEREYFLPVNILHRDET